jgi:hypothetical protein
MENYILTLTERAPSRSKVKRHYFKWREQHGIPVRCDNVDCQFHTASLVWNGKELRLTLDHKSGNAADNRPDNLRLLCPNCDSQNTETKGGANAGRINSYPDGAYTAKRMDGTTDTYLKQYGVNSASVGIPGISMSPPLGGKDGQT